MVTPGPFDEWSKIAATLSGSLDEPLLNWPEDDLSTDHGMNLFLAHLTTLSKHPHLLVD
jgi:hypothetical protein